MVAAAVTVILAVVLLCGLLYVLWRELRGRSKNLQIKMVAGRRGRTSPGRTVTNR